MENKNYFKVTKKVTAIANPALINQTLKGFWYGCSFRTSKLNIKSTDELLFKIGNAESLPVGNNEYSINVTKCGVCVTSNSKHGLIRGFITLSKMMRSENDSVVIDCISLCESAKIDLCIAHFCVFHNTEKFELEKFVKFCGALKYTHIILEFWGTLKLNTLKELAWKRSFSKNYVKKVVKIANDFGIEIIPMFNHWGHASASRVMHGKHVVLDQKPTLEYYFSDSGWTWNYKNEKTLKLLKNIRNELINICGNGSYFHIGCDEAYGFDYSDSSMSDFCSFVNEISLDLTRQGRRAIAWGDMFISKRDNFIVDNVYCCNAPSIDKENYFLTHLDKNIIIADWQYDSPVYPIQTSKIFHEAGFNVLICPWDRGINQSKACISTAKDGLLGILHTTWHTLSYGYYFLYYVANSCWEETSTNTAVLRTKSASLLRKVNFARGNYKKSGWSKNEVIERA